MLEELKILQEALERITEVVHEELELAIQRLEEIEKDYGSTGR